MSQFSRRARWLNIFFPQSVAPAEQDPGIRSDDVSLVQPYDGGAYPIVQDTDWLRFLNPPVAAAGDLPVLVIPVQEYFRFLGADVQLLGGNLPTAGIFLRAQPPVGGGGSIMITDNIVPVGNEINSFVTRTPVIGPDTFISMVWSGGNVATDLIVHIYGVVVPTGSVFYV